MISRGGFNLKEKGMKAGACTEPVKLPETNNLPALTRSNSETQQTGSHVDLRPKDLQSCAIHIQTGSFFEVTSILCAHGRMFILAHHWPLPRMAVAPPNPNNQKCLQALPPVENPWSILTPATMPETSQPP